MSTGARHPIGLRGTPAETRAAAASLVARLAEVLWVGPGDVSARGVMRLLGRAFDAVVIDLHAALDADLIGLCHGFVRGGGALILRLPPGELPAMASLAVHPFTVGDVGARFQRRFVTLLDRLGHHARATLAPPPRPRLGSTEQAEVVSSLAALLHAPEPRLAALLADRGRGKSAALGLALAAAFARAPLRVALSAAHDTALAEVWRFAPRCAGIEQVALSELADMADHGSFDAIVIDEAAQVPVPLLRRIARRHARSHLLFATTTRGYEGTGRAFTLRFLAWLASDPRPLARLTLSTPIRWDPDDPLERFVFDALLLDAEPAPPPPGSPPALPPDLPAERLDRDAISEPDLRALFGLFVHAHYRTTPGDLQRLLDAPNLAVHILRAGPAGPIIAANLIAHEGALTPAQSDDLVHGRARIRAHALADALVAHLGQRDAGRLAMLRSVRIAVHPALRRRGLARRLLHHVHASYRPDLFGTLFGATLELVAFRHDLGYQAVRVSASRGARSGEPSVLMLRPRSAAAADLVERLRHDLARDLPAQLELLAADGDLDPALADALRTGLPEPPPLTAAAAEAILRAYLTSPRTVESVAAAARAFIAAHPDRLAALPASARALIHGRVVAGLPWWRVAVAAGLLGPAQAMKAMRGALRELVGPIA